MSSGREALAQHIPQMHTGNEQILAALAANGYTVAHYPRELPPPRARQAAAARAYPMQGILKYHGLADWQTRIAYLPSISLNSDAAETVTVVEFDPALATDDISMGNQPAQGRERERVVQTLDALRGIAGVTWQARVETRNFFRARVAGKGLGSSASGSAALAVAAIGALFGPELVANHRFVSCIARLLAGSGCRAAVGGIALWVSHEGMSHEDSFAIRLDSPGQFADAALTTVPIPSRIGLKTEQAHEDAPDSTLFPAWMTMRPAEIVAMIAAVKRGDWHYLGRMAEIDSMRLHGVTMSGGDAYKIIGWEAENIAFFRMCNDLRAEGVPVYCSTDTGPTAVFMHEARHADQVRSAIAALYPTIDIIPGHVAGPAELLDVAAARARIRTTEEYP
ncbi:MAG: hypothetical protein RLZZ297_1911 [Chloroflexota bacterium]